MAKVKDFCELYVGQRFCFMVGGLEYTVIEKRDSPFYLAAECWSGAEKFVRTVHAGDEETRMDVHAFGMAFDREA